MNFSKLSQGGGRGGQDWRGREEKNNHNDGGRGWREGKDGKGREGKI